MDLDTVASLARLYVENEGAHEIDRERRLEIVSEVSKFTALEALYFAQQVASLVPPKQAAMELTVLTNQVLNRMT